MKGWRLPKHMSANAYHFYPGEGVACLCGRWKEAELLREAEDRRPIICADARKCVALWQQRYEPTRRTYQRFRPTHRLGYDRGVSVPVMRDGDYWIAKTGERFAVSPSDILRPIK